MKILVLNGSARKGNTLAAINALNAGIGDKHEVEVVNIYDLKVAPCKGCGACECSKGCIDDDDTNPIVNKVVEADMVVFATPVYWWGMTAQMKLVLDKIYCRGKDVPGKKIGLLIVGGDVEQSVQYMLIKTQFDCICEYLNWDMKFYHRYYAYEIGDLEKNADAIAAITASGAAL